MEKLKLSGFNISGAEKPIIENVIKNYEIKILRESDYNQISLRLRKSQHGKTFLHEVEGKLEIKNKIFNSKTADYNIFYAVSEALEKLLNELKHYIKK
jgi:ribosome-associated translation inhibitor RaiA